MREALRRLAGDGLVEFEVNRGFFVADFGLEVVLERLEARLLLEPQIARLAAARRTEADLAALREAIARRAGGDDVGRGARRQPCVSPRARAATQNEQLWRLIDGLWIADVGRRLLARRYATPTWQADDASEHEEILEAVAAGDERRAEALRSPARRGRAAPLVGSAAPWRLTSCAVRARPAAQVLTSVRHEPPGSDSVGQPLCDASAEPVVHPDVRLHVDPEIVLPADRHGNERTRDDVLAALGELHLGPLLPLRHRAT